MAIYMRIGPTTALYDLTDSATDGHVYAVSGGIHDTRRKDDYWIETIECVAEGTRTAIVNFEEDIIDHLENGRLFAEDKQRSTPIWYYEYADGETAKRAVVIGGSLTPTSKQNTTRMLGLKTAYYMLTIQRGPWEQTSATTILSAQTMDGVTNTKALSTIKGDVPGRISQTLIRGTATNTEAAPLTKVFAGIRREYGGVSLFDPVLNLEYATLVNDTTLVSIADSNTYPSGSSTDNALLVTFGDTVKEKRATLSLGDALKVTDLVTNGGAETGDLTGWTEDFAGWAADAAHKASGSYGFYGDLGTSATYQMSQIFAVTAGMDYMVEYDLQIYAVTATMGVYVDFHFLDSESARIVGADRFYRSWTAVNGSFVNYYSILNAPSNAASMKVIVYAATGGGGAVEVAIDDIKVYAVPADHYRGSYTALARAKLTGAGDVDIAARFGYTSSTNLNPIGSPQKVTNTDWKLIPLGNVTFPPGRALTDIESIWRMNNLGFEIYAQKISGSSNLQLDAIILVPSRHALFVDGCSICRSSFTINAAEDEYAYADLDVRVTEVDETVVIVEAADFLGINTAILPSIIDWEIPNEDGVFVCFAERTLSHEIADDFVVTTIYVPRYDFRNTD